MFLGHHLASICDVLTAMSVVYDIGLEGERDEKTKRVV